MQLRSAIVASALLLILSALPASGATIYTFSVANTQDFNTSSILSYAFEPTIGGGAGTFAFSHDIMNDAISPKVSAAVATGSPFTGATFVAYDGTITADAELFRYVFGSNVFFTAVFPSAGTRQVVFLTADTITRIDGPAAPAPEPASLLLLGTGLLGAGVRRWRQRRA